MCGLFGFTNFQQKDLKRGQDALNTLEHRGPNQWNDYYDANIYMGHRRLSILDLSEHGKQPMISENNNVVISVNGEIYNFQKLKNELKNKFFFKSVSDSEIILHGYIAWGIEGLLEKIDGMYAISIYDKQKNLLYLARDRVGIKPLYFSHIENQITWASELKAIQKFYENTDKLEYDYTAFYDFLTYLYIPTPKSMYKDVYKLEPAHYLKVDLRNLHIEKKRYWELKVGGCDDDIVTAKEKVYQLLKKSIDEQMVADVPVGFFLSGGLDSSTVVNIASQSHPNFNTYSIGFENAKYDETKYAEIVAQKSDVKFYKKYLNESLVKNMLHKIKEWYDEPFGDTSCFPTYYVSKFAKESSTVILTGDGGDEVFGGYNWYKNFFKKKKYLKPKLHFLKKFTQQVCQWPVLGKLVYKFHIKYLLSDIELYTKLLGGMLKFEKEYYKKLWSIPDDYNDYWYFEKFCKDGLKTYTQLQYLDFHTYLHDDILTKVDRVSMSVSLECRVPMLSKDILEYSFSISDKVRIYNDELKGIIKVAMSHNLPDQILFRKKKGFSIPADDWGVYKNKNKAIELLESFDSDLKL